VFIPTSCLWALISCFLLVILGCTIVGLWRPWLLQYIGSWYKTLRLLWLFDRLGIFANGGIDKLSVAILSWQISVLLDRWFIMTLAWPSFRLIQIVQCLSSAVDAFAGHEQMYRHFAIEDVWTYLIVMSIEDTYVFHGAFFPSAIPSQTESENIFLSLYHSYHCWHPSGRFRLSVEHRDWLASKKYRLRSVALVEDGVYYTKNPFNRLNYGSASLGLGDFVIYNHLVLLVISSTVTSLNTPVALAVAFGCMATIILAQTAAVWVNRRWIHVRLIPGLPLPVISVIFFHTCVKWVLTRPIPNATD
jgi:hypothetical protein